MQLDVSDLRGKLGETVYPSFARLPTSSQAPSGNSTNVNDQGKDEIDTNRSH
jgi:hypothetical protein